MLVFDYDNMLANAGSPSEPIRRRSDSQLDRHRHPSPRARACVRSGSRLGASLRRRRTLRRGQGHRDKACTLGTQGSYNASTCDREMK